MVERTKDRLLGPPLNTEQLVHERLGRPTALAVFASDNLSSSAYATEEILRVLVPAVGLAAFSLVVPLTVAMLVVLAFLILSYRQTIKAYPSAGGAYVVTRDNFGIVPAQVAGVSLLADYVLTVAVSVAAGTAALTSAVPALVPWAVPISVAFILVVAYGNLRGVRESGRVFAVPTYFFIVNMAAPARRGAGADGRGRAADGSRRPTRAWSRWGPPTPACSSGPACSSSSTPSPPAGLPSPGWRPSPTACPPSGHRSGGTPGRPSWSWAPPSG